MSHYLLDTNHLSPLVTVGHPLRAVVYRQLAAGDSFAIATPVLSEFLFGIRSVPRAIHNLEQWRGLRKYFAIYDVTEQIAEEAAEYGSSVLVKNVLGEIGLGDILACVIIAHKCTNRTPVHYSNNTF